MDRVLNKYLIFYLLLMAGLTFSDISIADKEGARIRIGLKLFRSILASDTKIKQKKNLNGELALIIVYKDSQSDAVLYARKLQYMGKGKSQGKIKKIPLSITTLSVNQLDILDSFNPAGIFIVEEITNRLLQYIINYGIKRQIIIYSPFTGAVEQGVTAGLFIGARVKPYINSKTLKTSQLQLKSFFLKVSEFYEP